MVVDSLNGSAKISLGSHDTLVMAEGSRSIEADISKGSPEVEAQTVMVSFTA